MDLFLGEETITLNFGKEPNRHCLFIDVKEDQLYLDGFRLMTTKKEFNYNKDIMFQKNAIRKKARIKTITFEGKVLAIDCGIDGRTFFKFFTRETYSVFRGKPIMTYSYWHDRSDAVKRFYKQDLHNPIKTWPVKYKKEVIA